MEANADRKPSATPSVTSEDLEHDYNDEFAEALDDIDINELLASHILIGHDEDDSNSLESHSKGNSY